MTVLIIAVVGEVQDSLCLLRNKVKNLCIKEEFAMFMVNSSFYVNNSVYNLKYLSIYDTVGIKTTRRHWYVSFSGKKR